MHHCNWLPFHPVYPLMYENERRPRNEWKFMRSFLTAPTRDGARSARALTGFNCFILYSNIFLHAFFVSFHCRKKTFSFFPFPFTSFGRQSWPWPPRRTTTKTTSSTRHSNYNYRRELDCDTRLNSTDDLRNNLSCDQATAEKVSFSIYGVSN